ncbi:Putative restriction endonuclease domain-containing protein [Tumidithrix helvetica PCC 7403]|uniref:Uma2 family endonuclease n=1 Tax=Tumidithrix helvetica TaxID=3457545 RepID=UPI003C85ACE5
MVTQVPISTQEIVYPESDGKPMASNTTHLEWIVILKENLSWLFASDPNVLVVADLFWYPVEGRNKIVTAPDVMVAIGRPKGHRGSYKQWEEGGIAPQVVFEILSPSNDSSEMGSKLIFFDRYGVEEYYIYDYEQNHLQVWQREEEILTSQLVDKEWVSPRLGIRFDLSGKEMQVFYPDGTAFLTYDQVQENLVQVQENLVQAQENLVQVQENLLQERNRAERLAAQLRALGVQPQEE